MSKLEVIGRIFLGLVIIIATATVEVLLRPKSEQQKQMEKDFEQVNKTIRQIEQMNKNGASFLKNTNMTALLEATRPKKKIPDYHFIDEIYSDLLDSLAKKSSVEKYFIEQRKGLDLKKKLIIYINDINLNFPKSKIKSEGIFDFKEIEYKGKMLSWEMYYFGRLKKKAVAENLRKIKFEMAKNEIERIREKNSKKSLK